MIQHCNMSYNLNHCFLPKVLVFTKPQNCSYNDVLITNHSIHAMLIGFREKNMNNELRSRIKN